MEGFYDLKKLRTLRFTHHQNYAQGQTPDPRSSTCESNGKLPPCRLPPFRNVDSPSSWWWENHTNFNLMTGWKKFDLPIPMQHSTNKHRSIFFPWRGLRYSVPLAELGWYRVWESCEIFSAIGGNSSQSPGTLLEAKSVGNRINRLNQRFVDHADAVIDHKWHQIIHSPFVYARNKANKCERRC